jgi:anti-anti-sigma regulatory factor
MHYGPTARSGDGTRRVPDDFQGSYQRHGRELTIELGGSITTTISAGVSRFVADALAFEGVAEVTIDLSRVRRLDQVGVLVLGRAESDAQLLGIAVRWTGVHRGVRRAMRRAGAGLGER